MAKDPAPPGPVYLTYAFLTSVAAPILHRAGSATLRKRGVSKDRIGERIGRATESRPTGRLIWFHAVSVGEVQSILGLIGVLGERMPNASFLVTTVTATSAEILASRMPPRTQHQFAPLDTPRAIKGFLRHWQPNLAVLVESEIWPRMIVQTERLGTPLVLVNARLSEKSMRVWQSIPELPKTLLARFDAIVTQTKPTADGLVRLGADPEIVSTSGDLKAAAAPLPVDQTGLDALRDAVGDRPVWVAASTHPGEEIIVAEAHKRVREISEDALLVLVPRHPERGPGIRDVLSAEGWTLTRRSEGQLPDRDTEIYLADTLGEMGVFFSLSQTLFLGGSLVPVGGHNPFEPAKFGVPVLHGPEVSNAAETYIRMGRSGAAQQVQTARELADAILAGLKGPDPARSAAALDFAEAAEGAQIHVADTLLAVLEQTP